MVELGRALRAVGDVDDARRVLEEARSVGLSAGASRVVAAATLALVGGGGRGSAIDLDDAGRAELLREALVGLGDEDVDLLVPVLGELALALVLTDAVDERVALCERALAEARRWGDPGGLASALFTQRIALMGPGGTEARAVGSDEVLSLPAADVAPQDRLAALLGKVEDHLELGRRATAEAALAEAEDLVDRFPHTYWRWATACWRTLLTIVDGRLDDAEAAAFAAHEIQPEHPEATAALGVNLVAVRLFQGRAEEVCDLLTEAANANPHIPAYRAVLALCAAESGQHDLAQSCIDHFADCDFVLPPDSNWLLAVAVLADAVATVGDAGRAERLARLLEPWADRQVILNCFGGGGAFWGPVSHQLGRLAVLLGDDVLGRALLERAVDAAEAMRAPLAAARAAEHLAPLA
jgi:tetratricopeptide (TPR) repeat protein